MHFFGVHDQATARCGFLRSVLVGGETWVHGHKHETPQEPLVSMCRKASRWCLLPSAIGGVVCAEFVPWSTAVNLESRKGSRECSGNGVHGKHLEK